MISSRDLKSFDLSLIRKSYLTRHCTLYSSFHLFGTAARVHYRNTGSAAYSVKVCDACAVIVLFPLLLLQQRSLTSHTGGGARHALVMSQVGLGDDVRTVSRGAVDVTVT